MGDTFLKYHSHSPMQHSCFIYLNLNSNASLDTFTSWDIYILSIILLLPYILLIIFCLLSLTKSSGCWEMDIALTCFFTAKRLHPNFHPRVNHIPPVHNVFSAGHQNTTWMSTFKVRKIPHRQRAACTDCCSAITKATMYHTISRTFE